MIRFISLLAFLLCCAFQVRAFVSATEPNTDQPVVLVEVNQQTQGYFTPPRLALVLQQAAADRNLYWPGARLYQLDKVPADIAQQQQQVLEQLRLLAIHWHQEPHVAQSLMQMRSQIKHWRFGQPIAVELDPDLVNLRIELNPRLDPGHYLIQVKKRRGFVLLFSLFGEQFVAHQQQKMLFEYVAPVLGSGLADASEALILRHAQQPVAVPVADWNREHRPLMPGDMVYIGLSDDWLTPDTSDLNQSIVTLLQHRIYP
jgi:hypothetical protein